MKFLVLLGKEIYNLKKNIGVLIILFLVPIFIIFIMGYAFQDKEESYNLGIINETVEEDDTVTGFLDNINEVDALNTHDYDSKDAADKAVEDGTIVGYVIIPKDFVDKTKDFNDKAEIEFYVNEAKPITAQTLEVIVNGYVEKYNTISTGTAAAINVMSKNSTYGFDIEKVSNDAVSYLQDDNDRITLNTNYIGTQNKNSSMSSYNQTTCGMTAMFILFLCLLWGSSNILEEKLNGTMTRLSLAPVRFSTILASKMFYIGLLAFLQFIIFFTIGHKVLDVPLGDVKLLLLLNIIFIVQAASLGLLVSVIAKSRLTSIGISFFIIMLLSPLGGLWFPLEVVPDGFRTFSSLLPTGSYMLGLDKIIIQNKGFESIIGNCITIFVYFALAFGLSIFLQKKQRQ